MTLLRKIQEAAVDSKTDITDLLRQCLILAARLGHDGFREWVEAELNGYPAGAELPPYRVIKGLQSIGHFMGALGEQINNIPLPPSNVPEALRKRVSQVEFRRGVGEFAAMLHGHDEDLISPWPADLVAVVAHRFIAGRTLMAANIQLPRSVVAGVLDTIRNKVLQFALDMESQAPHAGEAEPGVKPVPDERVTQSFVTIITGGTNIAVGAKGVIQTFEQVQACDLNSLKKHLTGLGLTAEDLEELEQALKEEPVPKEGQRFGPRVAKWMGNMVSKAAAGTWDIATSAAGELLAAALRAFYGLGG